MKVKTSILSDAKTLNKYMNKQAADAVSTLLSC